MPISQSRMIDLINAAQRLLDEIESIHQSIVDCSRKVQTGNMTTSEAFANLARFTEADLVPPLARATIRIEQKHFTSNRGRNASAARRQARKRLEARGEPIPRELELLTNRRNPTTRYIPNEPRPNTISHEAMINYDSASSNRAVYDDEAEANRELESMYEPGAFQLPAESIAELDVAATRAVEQEEATKKFMEQFNSIPSSFATPVKNKDGDDAAEKDD
jgi:hypothetical protein